MKEKPLIGVLPLYDEDRQSLWMLPGYLDCLQRAGALPLTLPQRAEEADLQQIAALCDGYLFTGGHDLNPALYGEQPHRACGAWNNERDTLESRLFRMAYAQDRPVLGICRGIQLINVMLGGSLYQDLPAQHNSTTEHHMSPPYDRPCHTVTVKKDSALYRLLEQDTLEVNSYHHQAIRRLGDGFRAMAVSEDGLVEAAECPQRSFVWGVQWHPEFCYQTSAAAQQILNAFAAACVRRAQKKLVSERRMSYNTTIEK